MPAFLNRQVGRADLVAHLRQAGVEQGDLLLVHSSLSKVGWILGGPREMIAALHEALGPLGTLVMPTFTFNMEGWNLPPFDPWRTASRVGVLTEYYRKMPDVRRTLHPTHSVAARGPLAAEILGDNLDYEPLGVGSPLDRVRALGGKILLIGVGQNRNSTVHVAESRAAMPYLHVPFTEDADHDSALYIADRSGEPRRLRIQETPGSSEGFTILDSLLAARGVTRDVAIGHAPSTIMSSPHLCSVVEEMLRENPMLLLSSTEPSDITLRRRRFMQRLAAREVAGS